MKIEILRTSDEARKIEEEEKMYRRCPECNRFQWFRKLVTETGIFGTWYKAHEYECICGCCWRVVYKGASSRRNNK